ncbi:uncharacterized protein CG45078-like isoform X7 [Episyrphus balteatus]|uniref:uncharacterized protein CG45078-like isoform X7 n=1 Tax=Episyrphus balteatus TaxID=286459 RepID=UPI0024869291|nr:uncharacterized protein CG45078-like isoform X7 [Episyrphus balteatus]
MVYESAFTTRRSYSTRPVVSSYSVSKKDIPWEKVPFVPRPTLIADPVTAFGKPRQYKTTSRPSILDPINRAAIKPSARVLNEPIKPYISARDQTRERVLKEVRQYIDTIEVGGNQAARTSRDSMDLLLPHLHGVSREQKSKYRNTYNYGDGFSKYNY